MQSLTPAPSAARLERTRPRLGTAKVALVASGIAFLAILFILPLASMVQYTAGHGIRVFWESISSPAALFSLRFSLVLALATTAINGIMGTLVAIMLVKHQFPLKGLLDSLVDLPLAVPASATGFTIFILYGPFWVPRQFIRDGRNNNNVCFSRHSNHPRLHNLALCS